MSVLTRAELSEYLIRHQLAGSVGTRREDSLYSYGQFSVGSEYHSLGLPPREPWHARDVLALMADTCGVSRDHHYKFGYDTIDPELTIDRLEKLAARLRQAAELQERVLLASGHPGGVLAVHLAIGNALRAAGCTLLNPASGWDFQTQARRGRAARHLRYLGGVAVVAQGGDLRHSHDPRPMRIMLDALALCEQQPPDLIIADHGFAGTAARASIETVAFADCNDPALFVGVAENRVKLAIPLDDNVLPHLYEPVTAYLLAHAKLDD